MTIKKVLVASLFSLAPFSAFAADCLTQHELDNPDHMYALADANSDQVVQDQETGLSWTRCPLGQSIQLGACADDVTVPVKAYTWEEALSAAETANIALYQGASDWRVPNLKELETIMAPSCKDRAMNELAFPTAANRNIYSSTPDVKTLNHVYMARTSDGHIMLSDKMTKRLVYLVSGVNP